MKIAIVVERFPPVWLAGTEIATFHLASHLAKRGHEVHVITQNDDHLPELREENGFFIHRINLPNLRFIRSVTFWVRAFPVIYKIKPDIIQSQNLYCGIPAWAIKNFSGIPYVVWGQGSDIYLQGRFLQIFSKPILRKADAALALTEDMKQKMKLLCGREICVIPNGVNLEDYKLPPGKEDENKSKTVIYVGRLHPVKGVQYLIEAMAIVHREMSDSRLIIVGDGSERSGLEDLAEKYDLNVSVRFTGQMSHERIPVVMRHADIFVLPSLSEGFPITILEAMASGLPIVATRVGGLPDIVNDGVNGFLVETRNPDEIANRLLVLMRNDILREKMSLRNRERAEQFTWENIAASVDRIYGEVVVNLRENKPKLI